MQLKRIQKTKYYHAYFLVDCARDMLVAEDIEDKLEFICDPNSYNEGRIYIKQYDLKFDKGGAIYNSKEQRFFYELLQ